VKRGEFAGKRYEDYRSSALLDAGRRAGLRAGMILYAPRECTVTELFEDSAKVVFEFPDRIDESELPHVGGSMCTRPAR
jgi:hypothetical protein